MSFHSGVIKQLRIAPAGRREGQTDTTPGTHLGEESMG